MLKFERILCPIDFSDFSAKAYDYAQSLARHYSAGLVLQHVVEVFVPSYPDFPLADAVNEIYRKISVDAERRLREFVALHSHDGLQPKLVVENGIPTESILWLAEKEATDLIVMGTHGRRGFDRVATGSVTEKVLRKANCPVLVVRKPAHDFVNPGETTNPVRLQKILFCTDFSEHSDRALSYALLLAMEYDAELTLLHVLEEVPQSTDLQGATAEVMRRLGQPVPRDARDWCTIKFSVRIGRPYQEIIQLALEAQTDLVIMGVRGRNSLDLALFGSTTQRVIQLGSCPVLAVHV